MGSSIAVVSWNASNSLRGQLEETKKALEEIYLSNSSILINSEGGGGEVSERVNSSILVNSEGGGGEVGGVIRGKGQKVKTMKRRKADVIRRSKELTEAAENLVVEWKKHIGKYSKEELVFMNRIVNLLDERETEDVVKAGKVKRGRRKRGGKSVNFSLQNSQGQDAGVSDVNNEAAGVDGAEGGYNDMSLY